MIINKQPLKSVLLPKRLPIKMCWVAINLSHFDFFYFAVSAVNFGLSDFLVRPNLNVVGLSRLQLFDRSLYGFVLANGDVLLAFFELFVLGVCNLVSGSFLIPFPTDRHALFAFLCFQSSYFLRFYGDRNLFRCSVILTGRCRCDRDGRFSRSFQGNLSCAADGRDFGVAGFIP